jgi:hypothetical protein
MAKTNWQDPKTSEMRSTHVAGLMEAVGKIEDSIGMESVYETNVPLTEVFISSDDRYRIFQAPEGKRNWTAEQPPVIKRNGSIITSGFEIDYGGGAIVLNVNDTVENTYTADVTYIAKDDVSLREQINNMDAEVVAHKAEDAKEAHIGLNDTTISLGLNSNTRNADGEVAIGYGATTGNLGNGSGIGNIAIGFNASTRNNNNNARRGMIAIGDNAIALNSGAIALGQDSSTSEGAGSVAIGRSASTTNSNSIAIGRDASTTSSNSIAIGYGVSADGTSSVAIGRGATSENGYEGVLGGVNKGSNHTVDWIVPGNFTVNGTKNFEIPHPKPEKKATHRIRHGAVESPTAGDTLYRFKVQSTKENDLQYIDLPDYFIHLNKDVQIFVTGQGHYGNGYGELNSETERLEIHCQFEGEYNVLVIGTRNDDHQSVQDWNIKGVEREVGESWLGETYTFSVDEIMEVEEIKEEEVA